MTEFAFEGGYRGWASWESHKSERDQGRGRVGEDTYKVRGNAPRTAEFGPRGQPKATFPKESYPSGFTPPAWSISETRRANQTYSLGGEAAQKERHAWLQEPTSQSTKPKGIESMVSKVEPETSAVEAPELKVGMTVWAGIAGEGPFKLVEKYRHPHGAEFPILEPNGKKNHYRMVTLKDCWVCEDRKGNRHLIPAGVLSTEPPNRLIDKAKDRAQWALNTIVAKREFLLWATVAGLAGKILVG